jgi:hypothetical protein
LGWTRKNFLNEINDCVATAAELLDNLKLLGWLPVAVVCGWTVGNQTNGLSLEIETMANDVTGSEDALDGLRGNGIGDGLEVGTGFVRNGDRKLA